MRAVLMTAAGGPEVLQLREVPAPKIERDRELLIRLRAAGINPIDTKLRRRGTFYRDQMPAVLGCDGAGIVEAVGAGVEKFAVGDEVYFCSGGLGSRTGNYAEWTVVDERFVARKPKSLSFEAAAAAPLVLITAWEGLYDRGRLEAGRSVLIQAAAGGVGHVAVQLAKLQGALVCGTVGSPAQADFVRQLGCDRAILYKQTDFVSAVLDWTNGTGVDLAFDLVGGETFAQTFPAVKLYGDLVTLLQPAPETQWKAARTRNLRISLELMLTPMLQNQVTEQQDQAHILSQCAQLFDRNQLKICVRQTFPLEAAAEAHRLLEQGSMMGKLVLTIL